ncbi:hypothetical protein QR680_014455 [Steinernema hermaphroditum]|uniref:Uncharacterized protein n=1 Tax=Steinernema hermaphroditum TaxID=289476 RepID=A0AA39M484_9BILA|nr:hypothetical protein QR680_014455 [Steinernema hermaphroditum]
MDSQTLSSCMGNERSFLSSFAAHMQHQNCVVTGLQQLIDESSVTRSAMDELRLHIEVLEQMVRTSVKEIKLLRSELQELRTRDIKTEKETAPPQYTNAEVEEGAAVDPQDVVAPPDGSIDNDCVVLPQSSQEDQSSSESVQQSDILPENSQPHETESELPFEVIASEVCKLWTPVNGQSVPLGKFTFEILANGSKRSIVLRSKDTMRTHDITANDKMRVRSDRPKFNCFTYGDCSTTMLASFCTSERAAEFLEMDIKQFNDRWKWSMPDQKFIYHCITNFGPNPYMPVVPNAPEGWEFDGYVIPEQVLHGLTEGNRKKLHNKLIRAHEKWIKEKKKLRERECKIRHDLRQFRTRNEIAGVLEPQLTLMMMDREKEHRKHYEEKSKKKTTEKKNRSLTTHEKKATTPQTPQRPDDFAAHVSWCDRGELLKSAYDEQPIDANILMFTGEEGLQFLRDNDDSEKTGGDDIYRNIAPTLGRRLGTYWTPSASEESEESESTVEEEEEDEESSWTDDEDLVISCNL